MKPETARTLSNDYQDVRLFSLHTWRDAASLQASPGHGPYVVMQTAIDPDNLRTVVEDFILGRTGRWLPMDHFRQLPQETRRELFVFSAASEVIEVLRGLLGKPTIERGQPADPNTATPSQTAGSDDSLNQAISEAFQRGAVTSP